MPVPHAGGDDQDVCAACPSLSTLLGAGRAGDSGAGQASQLAHSSSVLLDTLSMTWEWFPPSAPSDMLSGQLTHIWGQAGLSSLGCVCEILCSS